MHISTPSEWLQRHISYIPSGAKVLDVAAGQGRNANWLATQNYQVTAIDQDERAMSMIDVRSNLLIHDLEAGGWPFQSNEFDAILVCRYLYRPLFPQLLYSLNLHGVLIYETFMQGQESYGRPSNPDFLLHPGELEEVYAKDMKIVAFEQGRLQADPPAMIQRICCIKTQSI